jgi:hypothetical protein
VKWLLTPVCSHGVVSCASLGHIPWRHISITFKMPGAGILSVTADNVNRVRELTHLRAPGMVGLFLTPIQDVHKFPGVLIVFDHQFLRLLVDFELASWQQNTGALVFLIDEFELEEG